MNHLKLFEELYIRKKNDNKPKILYIHGSSSFLNKDLSLRVKRRKQSVYSILSRFGDDVEYPIIYWYGGEMVVDQIEDIINNNNIKALVGSSAGGHISFNMSNKYKIPAMSIVPAIASSSEAPKIQRFMESGYDIYPKQLIIVGEEDKRSRGGVDTDLVLEYLDDIGFTDNGGEIIKLQNTGHSLTNEQFNDMFVHFYKKFVL